MTVEWEYWKLDYDPEVDDTIDINLEWSEYYEPLKDIFNMSTEELKAYVAKCDKCGIYKDKYQDAVDEFKRRIWNVE